MAGTITKLAYQKRNAQRVSIFIDNVYAFALPDTIAAQLQLGQYLSDVEIATLQQVDTEAKAFDRALRFLGSRPRSGHEVEARLKEAGYSAETRSKTLAQLQRLNYIDDRAFASWWIENRSRFNPRSTRALQAELRQKGIPQALITEVLAELDDDELALAAGRKRAPRWRHLPQEDFEKKMLGYLQRRGFNYYEARNATDHLWQESDKNFDSNHRDEQRS